jgi:NAD(P)-dependent dehydrogenase (short-subunit alcohol dehydrogenase family)
MFNSGEDLLYNMLSALELGPHGINVNAYAPGAINTPMRTYLFNEC